MRKSLSLALLSVALVATAAAAHAQGREEARLLTSRQVIKELRGSPDQFIPARLLARAYGIAVVPNVTKAAFFFGASRGNGVLVVRNKYGRFSDQIFVNLTGGSFGFQWGIQSTVVVLVFTTQRSIDKITSGKITLGADASVAAGPIGRQATAATDPTISSEVYSYSRSRGLFLGVALKGSVISIDNGADARFYDRGVADAADIANGTITTRDDIARQFLAEIDVATGTTVPASASAEPAAPAYTPAGTTRSAAPGTQAFPLADPHPGAPPGN
ncbi:MAG: lipid-binding SYLF domain-containing protein [Steroidobacteraceae bacterium]